MDGLTDTEMSDRCTNVQMPLKVPMTYGVYRCPPKFPRHLGNILVYGGHTDV